MRHSNDDRAARAALLEVLSMELYLTDRLADAIEARTQALGLRRALDDVVAVGVAHRAMSYVYWYSADRTAAEQQDEAAYAILDGAGDRRQLGYALANRAYLAGRRGDVAEATRSTSRAQQIADELDEPALHSMASVGLAVARLAGGDVAARSDLLAAGRVGLQLRIDDLATPPMSHLAHFDVEQGRLVEADAVLDDALRVSEERDVPAACGSGACGPGCGC